MEKIEYALGGECPSCKSTKIQAHAKVDKSSDVELKKVDVFGYCETCRYKWQLSMAVVREKYGR